MITVQACPHRAQAGFERSDLSLDGFPRSFAALFVSGASSRLEFFDLLPKALQLAVSLGKIVNLQTYLF
jgi:hypothetical protein